MTTFENNKEDLRPILEEIRKSEIKLPDFQRAWIWDDEHARSLLASVSLSYPIGAFMMLETGNSEVTFSTRSLTGVDTINKRPKKLILDGQQRLTALFQSLYSKKPVEVLKTGSKTKYIKCYYYIDIAKSLSNEEEREEAINGYPEKLNPENEYEDGLFPLCEIFNYPEWRDKCNKHCNHKDEKINMLRKFEQSVISCFIGYQVPVIMLKKETPLEAICRVFEKVNTNRVELNIFDLLTARYAAYRFNLRDDWKDREIYLKKHKIYNNISNIEFLKTVTLLATWDRLQIYSTSRSLEKSPENAPAISCKRKDMFNLSLNEYKKNAQFAERGFEKAAILLHELKIFKEQAIPYRTQLIPLAAILGVLGDETDEAGVREKINQWYWCGVFGELYGSAVESRFAKDLPEVVKWIHGGSEPSTVEESKFIPSRLRKLKYLQSAAYKGVHTLLIKSGCQDFFRGGPINEIVYFEEEIDIHHIFPKEWCNNNGIDQDRRDCIVNKSPLSKKSHKKIGRKPPSEYLRDIRKAAKIAKPKRMNEILESHLIDPIKIESNNFNAFFEKRERKILDLIEDAMGKPVIGGVATPIYESMDDEVDSEESI